MLVVTVDKSECGTELLKHQSPWSLRKRPFWASQYPVSTEGSSFLFRLFGGDVTFSLSS